MRRIAYRSTFVACSATLWSMFTFASGCSSSRGAAADAGGGRGGGGDGGAGRGGAAGGVAGSNGGAGVGAGGGGTGGTGGIAGASGAAGNGAAGVTGAGGRGGGTGMAGAGGRGGAAGIGGTGGVARDGGTDSGQDRVTVVDGPAADSAVCIGLADLTLGSVAWSQQLEGSTAWIERPPVAGGWSRLTMTLTNTGADNLSYPGVSLTTTTPGVTGLGVFQLFGIASGMSWTLDWNLRFGGSLAPGAQVHFRAEVYGEDVKRTRCADSPAIEFDVVLQ
jgi:hypothetical protein